MQQYLWRLSLKDIEKVQRTTDKAMKGNDKKKKVGMLVGLEALLIPSIYSMSLPDLVIPNFVFQG